MSHLLSVSRGCVCLVSRLPGTAALLVPLGCGLALRSGRAWMGAAQFAALGRCSTAHACSHRRPRALLTPELQLASPPAVAA
eukprot:395256-Alexandrium_andersonii.AAC.1